MSELGWPIFTRAEVLVALQATVGDHVPIPPLLVLIGEYATSTRLLYTVLFGPLLTSHGHPPLIACYNEADLSTTTTPLWTLRLPLSWAQQTPTPFLVASGDDNVFVIDTYRSWFESVDVRLRTHRSLPAAPMMSIQTPAVAANARFLWVCGGTDHGRSVRDAYAFDIVRSKWVDSEEEEEEQPWAMLPEPLSGHSLTTIPLETKLIKKSPRQDDKIDGGMQVEMEMSAGPKKWKLTLSDKGDERAVAVLVGGEVGDEVDEMVPSRIVGACYLLLWSDTDMRLGGWTPFPPLLQPRSGHSAQVVGDRLIVVGGHKSDPQKPDYIVPVTTVEAIHLSPGYNSSCWTTLPHLPSRPSLIIPRPLLLVGEHNRASVVSSEFRTAVAYSPRCATHITTLVDSRAALSTVKTADGVVANGGLDACDGGDTSEVWQERAIADDLYIGYDSHSLVSLPI